MSNCGEQLTLVNTVLYNSMTAILDLSEVIFESFSLLLYQVSPISLQFIIWL